MNQRKFPLIRKPDLRKSSFLFNNIEVRYVATCPENNISFYVNNGRGGVIGVRVFPNGRKVLENPSKIAWAKKHGKAEYLYFKDTFGHHKGISASHAVYIAWRNKDIPAGMTIDHIDGCTTNNFVPNLRCVSNAINNRDGGFLRKLRHQGFNPGTSSRQTGGVASAEKGTRIPRWILLRYYGRMAIVKATVSETRYKHLDKSDLEVLLYYTNQAAALRFYQKYNLQLTFRPNLQLNFQPS